MSKKTGKIFASAGCGKTTALLNLLDEVFKKGARAERILFTTFTRAGAYEARDRAIEKFGFPETAFPYFRTLHSICYRAITGPKIMSRADYRKLSKDLHVRFGSAGLGEELYERGKGDALLALYNLQRNLLLDKNLIPEAYGVRINQQEYEYFIKTYDSYRNERGLFDYTDLLEEIVAESRDGEFPGLPVHFAFIDEAQDLTPLQYMVVKALTLNSREVWFAGDDDQCVFSYAGADPKILIQMPTENQLFLERSYRLPVPVAEYANRISHRIVMRENKNIRAFYEDKTGSERVIFSNYFIKEIKEGESTTILCRNRVFFGYFEEFLQQRGFLYSFVKATEAEEVLDPSDMSQIRRAILVWGQMIQDPDRMFPAPVILLVLQFIPTTLMRLKHRRAIKNANPEDRFSYNTLTKDHQLLAQEGWKTSLSGIPYELKQYMKLLEEKDMLSKEPHIKIGTIHSFKGKEDDHVIVLPDMSWQTWQTYQDNPDSEHRVFYVGVTRSKEKLTLLNPLTKYHYNW